MPIPIGDMCSTSSGEVFNMSGQNIGNLLNNAGVSWGWFEGGFDLTITNPNGTTGCNRSHTSTITGDDREGLHSPSLAVPVLRLDG